MLDSVAICLFGISYLPNYDHWNLGNKTIDYERSLDNYRARIFSQIPNYDVYISTYRHDKVDKLRKQLNAKKGYVTNEEVIKGLTIQSCDQRNRMISVFEEVLRGTSYEWYLFTRFDLQFNFNIQDLPYDKDKINVLAILERSNLICDNFYMVHKSQLDFFFHKLKQCISSSLNRHAMTFFDGLQHIHILTKEKGKFIADLNCYKIIRS